MKKLIVNGKKFDIGEDMRIEKNECIRSDDGQMELCNTEEGLELNER